MSATLPLDREAALRKMLTPHKPRRQPSHKTPYRCPVCNGAGKLNRPPWVAGDQETWASTTAELYDCAACAGAGVLWREPA